jgi:hypothetical protein
MPTLYCNTGTYFWSGTSFASAAQLYTDSNLTIVAPDGTYSVGGITRVMAGGVLGPHTPCPTCVVPCGTGINGSGQQGQYALTMDVGLTTGAVIVRFNPAFVPDRCQWTYDGVSASEYSCTAFGYLSGIIGGYQGANPPGSFGCSGGAISNLNGSSGVQYSGIPYVYDVPSSTFIATGPSVPNLMGPYTNQASGGTTLTSAGPGWAMMVIPKPNTTPTTVDFLMDGPCGGTVWSLQVQCPAPLNAFQCKPHPAACADPVGDPFYTAHPGSGSGASAAIFVNDWAFEDVNGVTHKAAGQYLVDNNGSQDCVTVSADGVVTSVTACSGSC